VSEEEPEEEEEVGGYAVEHGEMGVREIEEETGQWAVRETGIFRRSSPFFFFEVPTHFSSVD
jgi:hypothetical protein